MKYGLPYKGSKSAIAQKIMDALPSGESFCDACCGGGAILMAAALSGKYTRVTGYDINEAIVGLIRATMIDFGTIDYEHDLPSVDRKSFFEARNRSAGISDWLVRYCYSFGTDGQTFLWSDETHEGFHLLENALRAKTLDDRVHAVQELSKRPDALDLMSRVEPFVRLRRIKKVEQTMWDSKTTTRVDAGVKSMFEVDYEPFDVIYFDPPYKNTRGYFKAKFDYRDFEELISGLRDKGKRVFVSEYSQPTDGFACVAEFSKQVLINKTSNTAGTERLYFGGTLEEYQELHTHSRSVTKFIV